MLPVARDLAGARAPADFPIDPDGVLRVTHYGKNVNHMIPLEDASAFIAQ